MEKRAVTFSYEEVGRYVFVENVPAEVCTRCGEKVYTPEVTDMLLKFAKQEFKPIKRIQVPVFDYSNQRRSESL